MTRVGRIGASASVMVARSERAKPGVQGFPSHIDVKAEFVDEIPERPDTENFKGKMATPWQATPGVKEALLRAYENPKRAMLLLEYVEGAPSKKRNMAILRVKALENQGYNASHGWTVRAVDNKVYVMYDGVGGI